MRTPIGLWFLILLYTLVTISLKIHSQTPVQISDCIESCFAFDSNEVDYGQISLRTKLGTSEIKLNDHELLNILRLSEYPTYMSKLKFVFLVIHPSFQFLQKSFRPPIIYRLA